MTIKTAPYGSWKSSISPAMVATGGMSSRGTLFDVYVSAGQVYWRQLQAAQDGSFNLMTMDSAGEARSLLPAAYSVSTKVHEYGGGPFFVHDRKIFFSNASDQRLYRLDQGSDPVAISPEPKISKGLRYADGRHHPKANWLVCVQEKHHADKLPENQLVAINPSGNKIPKVVAKGHDFYASPRFDETGDRLLYLTWDHPNMPWDGTELWLASFSNEGTLEGAEKIAGGPEESIFQPEWGPDGSIYFISDRSGWWNLYRFQSDRIEPIHPMQADFGAPAWNFGFSRYAFLSNDRIACLYTQQGIDQLAILDPTAGSLNPIDLPFSAYYLPYLRSDEDQILWFLAGSATEPQALYQYDSEHHRLSQIQQPSNIELSPEHISVMKPITFPTGSGEVAHAFLYPPTNPDYAGPPGELPPLIVMIHSGPTSAAVAQFHLEKQYWTSRGYMVVDVNYRGSSGYGRSFRDLLKGQWGVVDVEDCLRAASFLTEAGYVDSDRLIIRGSSAGGFATLAALATSEIFGAGASYYGIADIEALANHTHKFEAHYLDSLIGPYPEAKDVYRRRSPLHQFDNLSAPLIIFQGSDDMVVPAEQANLMINALQEKDLAYAYIEFEGEGHGFKQASSVVRALSAETYFYSRVLGHGLEQEVEPIEIINWKE